MRKIISLCVVLLGLFVLQTACSAAERAQYKITHFHYTAAAGSLYVEVGLNNAGQDFALAVDPSNPQRLVLDLKKTKIGSIRKNIALDGEIAQKIEFSQLDKVNGQAVITLPDNAGKYSYKLRFVPADRKLNRPYRLVIEIKKKRSFGDFSVTGVRGRTIAIDPGHGGSDTGAIGPDGIREKDVTFAIAQRVDDILLRSGARVVMTRTDDVDVFGPNASDREELQARVDAGAAVPGVDVFVSIHANAFTRPQANGTQTFYYAKTSYDALLAQLLQNGVVEHGERFDRGASEANFYVLKHSAVPAALVETAFISNPEEEGLLADPDFQEKMAEGICEGLGNFFSQTGA